MRKTRNALIAAVALGTVLGTGSIAQAQTGAADNVSSVQAGISPNVQRGDTPGVAALTAQVQTFDADGGPLTIPGEAAEQVFLDFDDDLSILPGASAAEYATRQCTAADFTAPATFDTSNTAQVLDVCGDAAVGSGQAEALIPTGGGPLKLELTVTALNGATTTAGPDCQTPSGPGTGGPDGCDFVGGNPQIVLHAFAPAISFITTVEGEIQNSPTGLGADYGKRLAVTNAPDTAGDAGALILFNSTVGRNVLERVERPNGQVITKQFPYARAICGDDGASAGSLEYDFRGEWVYDDNTVDTDTNTQKCGTP
jgi:hypothetical protein